MTADWEPTEALLARVETLAGAWSARARTSTTAGQERALLRLFGVSGLDRMGRPLAGEVVDRYLSGGPGRLAGGVALPFAVALLEYDMTPQALALDVAAGSIDLALEAELLRDSGRRAAAEAEAARLVLGAASSRRDRGRGTQLRPARHRDARSRRPGAGRRRGVRARGRRLRRRRRRDRRGADRPGPCAGRPHVREPLPPKSRIGR